MLPASPPLSFIVPCGLTTALLPTDPITPPTASTSAEFHEFITNSVASSPLQNWAARANYRDPGRAGQARPATPLEVDELRELEIIKYVLNHDRFWVEEEMISWNPVVLTKARMVYKKPLANLTPEPFESYLKR
ncbi:hypothetical protein FA15DRAFT_652843 [Coprinopsis marcescibilis]|uniref:Uncharacterized protein n=1 Tax=Coprinopsis marcescibilis TaxID=230819 RepID=A0A5C3L6L2_COPMA|nr:hypothetical protein FA15DRAFT_652843 [Coprinopsis marcescibilis]